MTVSTVGCISLGYDSGIVEMMDCLSMVSFLLLSIYGVATVLQLVVDLDIHSIILRHTFGKRCLPPCL